MSLLQLKKVEPLAMLPGYFLLRCSCFIILLFGRQLRTPKIFSLVSDIVEGLWGQWKLYLFLKEITNGNSFFWENFKLTLHEIYLHFWARRAQKCIQGIYHPLYRGVWGVPPHFKCHWEWHIKLYFKYNIVPHWHFLPYLHVTYSWVKRFSTLYIQHCVILFTCLKISYTLYESILLNFYSDGAR